MRGKCLDNGALKDLINEKIKTNFKTETIYHQVKLLENKEFGPASEDAAVVNNYSKTCILLSNFQKNDYVCHDKILMCI